MNTLSSLANGSTGNLLTLALANFSGPVGIVPAINTEMSEKPATHRVYQQLKTDGYLLALEDDEASSDLVGIAQRGVSKHALRKLVLQLATKCEKDEIA